jgi:DNA sulfur modification protein DndE
MFLVLDALAHHLVGEEPAPVDTVGHRGIRHLLVVDEAVQVVRHRHEALRRLVRQSAAKGGVVMLLSQSPDDFDQEDEDFLQNMGIVAAFKSQTDSVKSLRAVFGGRIRPEDFADSALPRGIALVKLPDQEARRVVAWR